MITNSEQILFVGNASIIATIKQKVGLKTGFVTKKLVVTTKRIVIFDFLLNQVEQIEYYLATNKALNAANKVEQSKHLSVNEMPEMSYSAEGFQSKVVIDEEAAVHAYFKQAGIENIMKSIIGVVFLKEVEQKKFFVLRFDALKKAIRFTKALICAQAWINYQKHCTSQLKSQVNVSWIRILIEAINDDQNAIVLIDPQLFKTGSQIQINTFKALISAIPFLHCFHHRYSIITKQAANYAAGFIQPVAKKVHSLNFTKTNFQTDLFSIVFADNSLKQLMQIDLSHNKINDNIFQKISTLMDISTKLSYINLSYNNIKLSNSLILRQMLKKTQSVLNLNFAHNFIQDNSLQTIQKFIIFSSNPPLQELDLSFNSFSKKAVWRMYLGNIYNFKNHPYLRFIIYPLPIKKEIFTEYEIDFPRHKQEINMNIHSALIDEFEQQSQFNHTLTEENIINPSSLFIRFTRDIKKNIKIPSNKQQIAKTLQISNKLENFINANPYVQSIYDVAMELKNFPYEIPPSTRNHFVNFLLQKLNQALFIRDHYSVGFLFDAIKELQIPWDGYAERLQKVQKRNENFGKRLTDLFNFNIGEDKINSQLDELVKQSLRLYLEGKGVDILYYLKYRRDQYIQQYLNDKMNPEHYLFSLMSKKSITTIQPATEQQFLIPYEIKLQKKINQNFYLYPWQTNYFTITQLPLTTFQTCLNFLQQSEKKQKFAIYFQRIEERVSFVRNQFLAFTFKKFLISYSDLKINACRLIYLYNNIRDTHMYSDIPVYSRTKKSVTPERSVVVKNPSRFQLDYHISKYPNINIEARRANIYNYTQVMSKHKAERFIGDINKILPIVNHIIELIAKAALNRTPIVEVMLDIAVSFKLIIKIVRVSSVPEELKEEIYLHLITTRSGKYAYHKEILALVPALTMYLKPPLYLEKYIVAALLELDHVSPLCIVSDVNERTTEALLQKEANYVERDWLYTNDKHFAQIFRLKGKINVQIMMLEKKNIKVCIAESKTVSELLQALVVRVEMSSDDRKNFWLYSLNQKQHQIIPYSGKTHIGQILNDLNLEDNLLVLKRRIYCRQLKYNYQSCSENTITSLYHDIKFSYLFTNFFVLDSQAINIASQLFIIDVYENLQLNQQHATDEFNKVISSRLNNISQIYLDYVPRAVQQRMIKKQAMALQQLKERINERLLKREHKSIVEMRLQFLRYFSQLPQFCSTNYVCKDKDDCLLRVSVNSIYLFISSPSEEQYIYLEKIVSIMPRSKYLMISYHKHQNIATQWPIYLDQTMLFTLCFDIFTYLSMRLHMPSSHLYELHHADILEKNILQCQARIKKTFDKEIQLELNRIKSQYEGSINKIAKMNLTLMDFQHLFYFKPNLYIRLEIARKLYANKSQNNNLFHFQTTEEEAEAAMQNSNLIELIFPQKQHQYENQYEHQFFNQSSIQQKEADSMDYQRDYERLNQATKAQKKQLIKQKEQEIKYRNDQPPELKSLRKTDQMQTPIKQQPKEDEEVLNSNKKTRERTRRRNR